MQHAARLVVLAIVVTVAACASRAPEPPAPQVPPTPPSPVQWDLDWADGAVFYEIFVRSFADSDGDGIGDLRGLTARLDYLNDGDPETTDDLGVEGLWLMPIFVSPSYHGYDTVDYRRVNPQYGTEADLLELLEAAHARGIRVIVDLMLNHTGVDHPWFQASASSIDDPRRDWYVWRDTDPGWTQPWSADGYPVWHPTDTGYYYGIFWSGMPDLNFRNPEVRAETIDIARFWLARGLDGFRLDAARHLVANGDGELQNDQPETHAFWREFSRAVRETRPSALLVGENWTDTDTIATYYGDTSVVARGDELPMNFDFPLASAIIGAVREGYAGPVTVALAEIEAAYPAGVLDGTFLANHDMPRLATQLGNDPTGLDLAASILLTLPGTPFLYYGEEIGMTGDKPDPDIRTPMQWRDTPGGGFTTGDPWRPVNADLGTVNVATQTDDPASLLSHYRTLIHLRAGSPALRTGALEMLDAPDAVLAFVRTAGDERVLVVHNLSAREVTVGPWLPDTEGITVEPVGQGGVAHLDEHGVRVDLRPRASAVISLD